VLDALAEEFDALMALAHGLEPSAWELPTACPGWFVRDQFAHVIGTERMLLGEEAPPAVDPLPGYVRNPIGALNEAWVRHLRSLAPDRLVRMLDDVLRKRLEALRSADDARFDAVGPSPVGMVPYREFMLVRTMDCWVHEQDVRSAVGRPGHEEGRAPEVALDRLVAGVPYVVAKKAGAPEGSRVVIVVTGSLGRSFEVVVRDGRGRLKPFAEAHELAPDGGKPARIARVEMPLGWFWRLACGRAEPADALASGAVVLQGDPLLARRVVEELAFMV
jgi:uncharacterized protein (TIGR03083 family)